MRIFRGLLAAGFAAAMSVTATAGEYNWSGFYVGGVASGGMFQVDQSDYWCDAACDAPKLQDWAASIGLQAGHNWQDGNFVYGLVVDWSTGFDDGSHVHWDSGPLGRADFDAEWNSYATIRARGGISVGNTLLFGTAGVAIVDADYSAIIDQDYPNNQGDCSDDTYPQVSCASHSGTSVGFAGGFGLARPLGDSMHMSFEYLHIVVPSEGGIYDYVDVPDDNDDRVDWASGADLARVSVVWEFH